jgi:hypothetical protein
VIVVYGPALGRRPYSTAGTCCSPAENTSARTLLRCNLVSIGRGR